jgi:hypothetical protein
LIVAFVATCKNSRTSGRRSGQNRESGRIFCVARSRSPTLESARAAIKVSGTGNDCFVCSIACARISSRPGYAWAWEKRGRTALVKGDRRATNCHRFSSCVTRGTGLDPGEGEFSPIEPRDHGAGLVALSSLALGVSIRIQGVRASHRTGFKATSKMGLFLGKSSHFVPFCPIHFCLFGACETYLMSPTTGCRRPQGSCVGYADVRGRRARRSRIQC